MPAQPTGFESSRSWKARAQKKGRGLYSYDDLRLPELKDDDAKNDHFGNWMAQKKPPEIRRRN